MCTDKVIDMLLQRVVSVVGVSGDGDVLDCPVHRDLAVSQWMVYLGEVVHDASLAAAYGEYVDTVVGQDGVVLVGYGGSIVPQEAAARCWRRAWGAV